MMNLYDYVEITPEEEDAFDEIREQEKAEGEESGEQKPESDESSNDR